MGTRHKVYLRAADLIRQQLTRHHVNKEQLELPVSRWDDLKRLMGSVELAHRRGWLAAARQRREQFFHELDYYRKLLAHIAEDGLQAKQKPVISTLSEIYDDLLALEKEFPAVECDLEAQYLAVTTEPITLDGIYLGPFQIRLDLQHLGEAQPYSVVALEPHPAAGRDDITHPHVRDETLCEGEGHNMSKLARESGRIFDYFTIVDRTLKTYSEGRAFIELDQWNGVACHDCGGMVDDEDCWTCERCEHRLCSDCGSTCSHCDRTCCGGCSHSCHVCDEAICAGCTETCRSCGHLVCSNCFHTELNHCVTCHEEFNVSADSDSDDESAEEAQPAVHADRVGQAPVPA